MKFTVNAGALAKELSLAMGAVEKKVTIPILGNVLLAADKEGLRIETTDLEISFSGRVPADVQAYGSVTIPAQKLSGYVRQLYADSDMSFELAGNLWATMKCGKGKVKMAGMGAESWPETKQPSRGIATVPAGVLIDAFSRTAFAITEVQVSGAVPGADFQIKGGTMTCTTADGRRLALTRHAFDSKAEWKAVIPRRVMAELSRTLSDGDSVAIAEDDNHLFFSFGDRRIVARKLAEPFPNYAGIAKTKHPNSVEVSGSELSSAISRIAGFSDDQSKRIDITFGPNILLEARLDDGSGEEEIDGAYNGDPVTIGFVAPQVLQAIKSCGGGRIRIAFKGPRDALVLTPAEEKEGESCINLVMPLFIR